MKKGTIVLTPFPFTDLAGQKNRPALVLALSRRGEDVILAFISSIIKEPEETDLLISRAHPDFVETGLKRDSIIKLDKLATISRKIVLGRLGDLSVDLLEEVNEKLREVLNLKSSVEGMSRFERITCDAEIMKGQACIRGLRIPVSAVVDQVAHGATFERILYDNPDLEREDIQQALEYAAWLARIA